MFRTSPDNAHGLDADRPRVSIRSLTSDDAAEAADLALKSQAFHLPSVRHPLTASGFCRYIESSSDAGMPIYGTYTDDDQVLVGLMTLTRIALDPYFTAEVGCSVHVEHRGRGVMSQALAQLTYRAFDELGLHRVEALVAPSNCASQAMLRRCGFRQEGVAVGSLLVNGEWCDQERWALIDADKCRYPSPTDEGGESNAN